MSYTVTDSLMYNSIQYTLLETPNNGVSYGSNLYTVAEVAGRLNFRLDMFNKLTGIYVRNATTDTATANIRNQIVTNLTDVIDILELSYNDGTGWNVLPPGSITEADSFINDQVGSDAAVSIPSFYSIDVSPLLAICLYPPPSGAGTLRYCYIPRIGTMASTPDGSAIKMPDDFTPYVKYGVLADLFNKSGETYDPFRAQICESLFTLGLQVARSWVSGKAE